MRRLAELLQRVEVETPAGGQAVSFEPLGWLWFEAATRRRRERDEPGGPRSVESMTVEARRDPRVGRGLVLRFDGGDWRIVQTADDDRAGRVILTLERDR